MKTVGHVAMLGLALTLWACTTRSTIVLDEKQQALVGKKLYWQKFVSSPDARPEYHEHCSFCAVLIRESPLGGREQGDGYTTDDRSQWVCNSCFDRFNPRFRWLTK